jgi:hypothetical protein
VFVKPDVSQRLRKRRQSRTDFMRPFITACFTVAIIAIMAAAVLDDLVQQSSSAAFAEPSARI